MKKIVLLLFSLPLIINVSHAQVEASIPSGFYTNDLQVLLHNVLGIGKIHYTLDGSRPDTSSVVFEGPIAIYQGQRSASLSYVPTGEEWVRPEGLVYTGTTLRTVVIDDNGNRGDEATFTYFIHPFQEGKYPIDRVALTVDSVDFFGNEEGIYVEGTNEVFNFYQGGEEWERPLYFELFNSSGDLEFSQALGARIHGRSSRTASQKSLRLYAKSDYGSPFIFHPIFGEDHDVQAFKRVILRAPDRLFTKALFIDNIINASISNLEVDNMESRPVAVFINGEYWGIQSLRERHDEQYVRIKHGIDPDDVDVVGWDRGPEISAGDNEAFDALMEFLQSNDFTGPNALLELEKRIDLPSFIKVVGTNIFFANEDFPNNNLRMWRKRSYGQKWNFFYYDCDACMRDYEINSFEYYRSERNDGNPVSLILDRMLDEPAFQAKLSAFLFEMMSSNFSKNELLELATEYRNLYGPLVSEHIKRWNHPNDMNDWNAAQEDLNAFIIHREAFLSKHIKETLAKPFGVYPNPVSQQMNLEFLESYGNSPFEVVIHDMMGKRYDVNVSEVSPKLYNVDFSQLNQGFYILQVSIGGVYYFERVTKL
jgi:hypothetical protein